MKGIFIPASVFYSEVFRYINGKQTLEKFEQWLVSNLNELLSIPNSDVSELVNIIELARAEMSEGHRTEREFKEEITQYLSNNPTLTVDLNEDNIQTTSSSSTTQTAQTTIEEADSQFAYRLL